MSELTGSSNEPFDPDDNTGAVWVMLTCDECGETYRELAVLHSHNHGKNVCFDCRDDGPLVANGGFDGHVSDLPLMEFGPQSNGWFA